MYEQVLSQESGGVVSRANVPRLEVCQPEAHWVGKFQIPLSIAVLEALAIRTELPVGILLVDGC